MFSRLFCIQVYFETSLPDEFKITTTPFAVPARLSRLGLSEIINHLLELSKVVFIFVEREYVLLRRWASKKIYFLFLRQPRPFDFLIGGELIRCSLSNFLET